MEAKEVFNLIDDILASNDDEICRHPYPAQHARDLISESSKKYLCASNETEAEDKTAILFADWIWKNKWNSLIDMGKQWWAKKHGMSHEMNLTTEELFSIFKEEMSKK